jgi:hypothetical protein
MMHDKLKLIPVWLMTFIIVDFLGILAVLFGVIWRTDTDQALSLVAIFGVVFCVVIVCLRYIHLSVKLELKQLTVSVVPFSYKPGIIEVKNVKSWQIRKHKPLSEFKGYGKRRKFGAIAYVVDSPYALDFELNDGSKIIVSIKDKNEWQRALERSSVWAEKMKMD